MSDKPVVMHFEYVVYSDEMAVNDDDCKWLIEKFLDAMHDRGLKGGGGTYPCEGTECRRRKGHLCQ